MQNCWEFKKCGREACGAKFAELGVCSAAIERKAAGIHGGINAGRCCWAVAGTLCGGRVQGTNAAKMDTCLLCEFYLAVAEEEGADFLPLAAILRKLYE